MKYLRRLSVPVLLLMSGGCWPILPGDGSGRAAISPGEVEVMEWGQWEVSYRPGPGGIAPGGGVRIGFPRAWFMPRENVIGRRLQTTDPFRSGYLTARTDAPGAELRLAIIDTLGSNVSGRFDRVVEVRVEQSPVMPGHGLTVVFGDRSSGGRGWRAPPISGRFQFEISSDADGDGRYRSVRSRPMVRVNAGPAVELVLTAPSVARIGRAVPLTVAAFDTTLGRYLRDAANPASGYRGLVRFFSSDPQAQLPPPYRFDPDDAGVHRLSIRFGTPGVHRVWASGAGVGKAGQAFVSNPVDVRLQERNPGIFWGDIHSHTAISPDAVDGDCPAYARDTADLDFCAFTDHAVYLTPKTWRSVLDRNERYSRPGRFLILPAYSWSLGGRLGDHNIYFDEDDPPLIEPDGSRDPAGIWSRLDGLNAVVVPLHPAVTWGPLVGGQPWFDWNFYQPGLMPLVEIYSLNGASEFRTNPNGYRDVVPLERREEARGPYYVRYAWSGGARVGVAAGSDDHSGRPGRPEGGLTAVLASELTRSAILEAMKRRRTYATTGARILLDFRVDGRLMGESYTASGNPAIEAEVHGTGRIRELQVMKYDFGSRQWSVPVNLEPNRMDVSIRYVDDEFTADSLYYLRLMQAERYRQRWVMAWSSPVWVDYPG